MSKGFRPTGDTLAELGYWLCPGCGDWRTPTEKYCHHCGLDKFSNSAKTKKQNKDNDAPTRKKPERKFVYNKNDDGSICQSFLYKKQEG